MSIKVEHNKTRKQKWDDIVIIKLEIHTRARSVKPVVTTIVM